MTSPWCGPSWTRVSSATSPSSWTGRRPSCPWPTPAAATSSTSTGPSGNRTLRALAAGAEACLVVTLLDGLVLARSAFHHSMNYRSVVLYGRPSRVEDEEEMRAAATALLEHMAPGRSADARPPSDAELRATLVVRFPITEGSAKVRTGAPGGRRRGPGPSRCGPASCPSPSVAGAPVPDEALAPDVAQPVYVHRYPPRPGRA